MGKREELKTMYQNNQAFVERHKKAIEELSRIYVEQEELFLNSQSTIYGKPRISLCKMIRYNLLSDFNDKKDILKDEFMIWIEYVYQMEKYSAEKDSFEGETDQNKISQCIIEQLAMHTVISEYVSGNDRKYPVAEDVKTLGYEFIDSSTEEISCMILNDIEDRAMDIMELNLDFRYNQKSICIE